MRDIKFRAYLWSDKHTNDQWVYWEDGVINFWNTYLHWKADKSLMQFTGLLDKQGKKIYEGDIICYPDTYSETVDVGLGVGLKVAETAALSMGTVIFFEGSFCLDCPGGETLGKGKHTFIYIYNWYGMEKSDLEVIGNIWENPELLKER